MILPEHSSRTTPGGLHKLLHVHWPIVLLLCAIAMIGVLMLYSAAGGSWQPWAEAHLLRFGFVLAIMFAIAVVPIDFWCNISFLAWAGSLSLLVAVEYGGVAGGGAKRWIELGGIRLQPSELMKISQIMILAAYYDWLSPDRISRPLWILPPLFVIAVPAALVLQQPDLGTAAILVVGGGAMMFLAGVHWGYFATAIVGVCALVGTVLASRGMDWQLLDDYQFRRIDTFLDPSSDPLGAGYHISQSLIALGSGGWSGRGFLEGTQSRLNFLPEKHTDFIFTTLAEEFGFVGSISILVMYALITAFAIMSALRNRNRFASLLVHGVAIAFFLYFSVNTAMVTGLAPVVGVPLPLISYGGSAMLVVMVGFGLVQSAHIHRPR